MWDNPRLLNGAAGTLVGFAAFIFLFAAALLVVRSPLFPITAVELTAPPGKTERAEIEAALRERIAGNFFAVAPDEVRAALERLPWVRRASVRRLWPDRLQLTLEERVALARWGGGGLLDIDGERFAAATDAPIPTLVGPAGSEREMALGYARFAAAVAPLGARLERVVLSERGAWELELDNGLHIALGRDAEAAEARLARFVAAYPATLARIRRSHEYVDLRYPNGFAVRVRGVEG